MLFRSGVLRVNSCARPRSTEPLVRFAHFCGLRIPRPVMKKDRPDGQSLFMAEHIGLVPPVGLEPTTLRLEIAISIQLKYGGT